MNILLSTVLAALAVVTATPVTAATAHPATVEPRPDPVADRAAILAMQGEYLVDFAFDETVLLQPGYERAPAMRSGGSEAVIVVEDTPGRIVLQHILVDDRSGHVTKHWRQDWVYEAAQRFEFSDDQTWTVHAIDPAATRGAWTQCVYEVSDAPRYCGTGAWRHAGGIATWTSDITWRPLPRREYVRRSDYNALAVVNQHTITPAGWTHEQFNTKVRREADGSRVELVREFGFNDYQKTSDVDFEPVYAYWAATADFWAGVRARWSDLLTTRGLHMKTEIDGMAIIMPLFTQAAEFEQGQSVAASDTDAVFAEWVEPAPTRGGASASVR